MEEMNGGRRVARAVGKKENNRDRRNLRKSSTGKWENVEEEEGECGPQKDRGLLTTYGGTPSTLSTEAKERLP
jgi:hypothetical protein